MSMMWNVIEFHKTFLDFFAFIGFTLVKTLY